MRFNLLALAALAGVLLVACAAPALDQARVNQWIDAKQGAAELDLSGIWNSAAQYLSGGWGQGAFTQKDGRVSGSLGLYNVEGRVVGKQAYLMFLSGNKVFWTTILELDKAGSLVGTATSKAIADAPEGKVAEHAPVLLVRAGNV